MIEDPKSKIDPGESYISKSSLYREFLAERTEILRHKWLESERSGKDIGFEAALLDWMWRHRSKWKQDRKMNKESFTIAGSIES